MDSSSESSDWEESRWTVPIDDDKDPQKGSTDLHTDDCPFCSCLIRPYILSRTELKVDNPTNFERLTMTRVRHFLFHEECQSCSSPYGAQIPLCDFCKHLRLEHLVWCIWKGRKLSEVSELFKFLIDLDPTSRALGRTKCNLCDFLTSAISHPKTGVSEVEMTLGTSATLIIDKIQSDLNIKIEACRSETTRPYSVRLNVDRHQGTQAMH